MRGVIKRALIDTLPVMTGYLVLGMVFGIITSSAGLGILQAIAMSVLIYAGSMQYAAIGLITGGASLLTVALTTLMVNARHLFYGISMIERYGGMGAAKPYLIFALTDETYSLVCRDIPDVSARERKKYYFFTSLFDHLYWISGTASGALLGAVISFDSRGIDFALTALFVTVFLEQWLSTKRHLPAICGVLSTLVCLIIFGKDGFLIPSMLLIALFLCFAGEVSDDE